MKITIFLQHLDGNDPENFNADAWLEALEQEYREICARHFPGSEVVVDIDRRRRSSGYTRPTGVDFDDDVDVLFDDKQKLEIAINEAQNDLWARRSDEFFNE